MAATFSFSIRDGASPTLALLIRDVRNASLAAKAAARGVANKLRDHFAELEATRPNKMGFPRQHFWARIRKAVGNPVLEGDVATVTVADVAFRQTLEGGTIRPGPDKEFLTIAASPESYGKRAREFSGLQFAYAEDPNNPGTVRPALIAQRAVSTLIQFGKRKAKAVASTLGLLPLYWLVREVTQAPTPGAVPTDAELQQAAAGGANEWAQNVFARINQRRAGGAA
jgi:hypothetical protein